MNELPSIRPPEYFWHVARRDIRNIVNNDSRSTSGNLVGKVFERLSLSLVKEIYPRTSHIILGPSDMRAFKGSIDINDINSWGLNFPDGIVFERIDSQWSLRLEAITEYKMASLEKLEDRREQFDGFVRLLDFLRADNASKGKNILGRYFGREIPRPQIPETAKFLYVTPQDRSADATTTLFWGDHVSEIRFPQSARQIKDKVKQLRFRKARR